MTEIQRCIICVNMMGVILEEYDEVTDSLQTLRDKCERFAHKQGGVSTTLIVKNGKRGYRHKVVRPDRHARYLEMCAVGDKIWKEATDHFSKKDINADAYRMVEAIYLFHEDIILKHTTIKRNDILAYRAEHIDPNPLSSVGGTSVGGYIMELLAREMGIKVNGPLRVKRLIVESAVKADPALAEEKAYEFVRSIKGEKQ